MAHSALFDHIKLRRLMRDLKIPRPHAIGYWECFCKYVGDQYPSGDISSMTPEDVEEAAEWEGEPGQYFDALIKHRFIDQFTQNHSLVVHDWLDWCPEHVKKRAKRMEQRKSKSTPKTTSTPRLEAENEGAADNGSQSLPRGGQRQILAAREERRGEEERGDTARPQQSVISCLPTLSEAEKKRDRESKKALTADAEQARETDIDAAGLAALREYHQQTGAEFSENDFFCWPPRIQLVTMLAAAGCDAEFRQVVSSICEKYPQHFSTTIKAFKAYAGRRNRITRPGAWMRTALRKGGMKV